MTTRADFLAELFASNPDIRLADANKAWKQAGNEGEISESSFYKGKRTPAPKKTAKKNRNTSTKAATQQAQNHSSNGHAAKEVAALDFDVELDQMESDIDHLLFRLSSRPGTEQIQETLRSARRQIIRLN